LKKTAIREDETRMSGEKAQFYAHTNGTADKKKWQLLKEHLENTANLAKIFADKFNAGEWGHIAGIWHDIGKYSDEFQKMLKYSCDAHIEQKSKVDHSTYGAQCANRIWPKGEGKTLAYVIAGHHTGLPDGKSNDESCLNKRIEKTLPYHFNCPESLYEQSKPTFPFDLDKERFCIETSFFIRMLFSCLVDADFLDTEKYMSPEKAIHRPTLILLDELYNKLEVHLSDLSNKATKTKVNILRFDILRDCLNAAKQNTGLFSLTVPTGGGKTLSSMAFGLKHAIKSKQKRIIYVIPYTSIIEQNAQVFRDIFGEQAVLEHHSNYEPAEEEYKTRLAGENWDAPIIVTTNVQFFESLFACRGSRCRKLHNIAQSVVILDEIQTLPSELLLPCLEVIRELTLHYNCTIVLCSATQPAIQYSGDFTSGLCNVREITTSPHTLYDNMKRVQTMHIGQQTDESLSQRIMQNNQVLCVVNTRKHAKTLFQKIISYEGVFHLSASMYPLHRSRKLQEIKAVLKEKQPCRVISTQLVEAGVDIDFPIVFRAIAGLDSIAQAAGRCNREGLLDYGQVFVFEPEENLPAGYFRHTSQTAEGIIRRFPQDMLSLNAIEEYFKEYYWKQGEQLDKEDILGLIKQGAKACDFPFRTIAEKFKLISEENKPVIIPIETEAQELVERIRYAESLRGFSRKLQKYTVQIKPYYWNNLYKAGSIEIIQGIFPVLRNIYLYNDNTGLDTEYQNPDPESLIG
jgi:CRISPR-associated endonuclease/helicase Cas3